MRFTNRRLMEEDAPRPQQSAIGVDRFEFREAALDLPAIAITMSLLARELIGPQEAKSHVLWSCRLSKHLPSSSGC
jgi:hypothetical protein